MRQLNHPHLIRANAAFERGRTRGFIFPWADRGSLSDVLQKEHSSLHDEGLLEWALSQMEGLIDGIAALAATKTRHGDLKPANILCFSASTDGSRGILKVADVGLAKYHREYTADRLGPTTAKFASKRYMPPEAILKNVVFSRRYDMWSFGCVLLEFLIWLTLGRQSLQKFVAAATFDKEEIPLWKSSPLQVSKLAEDWMENVSNALERAPHYAKALADVLDLVRTRLLRTDVDDRAYAQEALRRIQDARNRGKAYPLFPSNPTLQAPLRTDTGDMDKENNMIVPKSNAVSFTPVSTQVLLE